MRTQRDIIEEVEKMLHHLEQGMGEGDAPVAIDVILADVVPDDRLPLVRSLIKPFMLAAPLVAAAHSNDVVRLTAVALSVGRALGPLPGMKGTPLSELRDAEDLVAALEVMSSKVSPTKPLVRGLDLVETVLPDFTSDASERALTSAIGAAEVLTGEKVPLGGATYTAILLAMLIGRGLGPLPQDED